MKETDSLNQSTKGTLNFWVCAGLLGVLLASIMARDIDRPFYGLHSWGEAGCALKARNYLRYDLSYTKGFAVWSVSDPPNEIPAHRSLDHPQLGRFLPAVDMKIFGQDEKGLRIGGLIRAVVGLLIFLKLVRGLTDDKTAILAGLLYALFPITGYFGTGIFGELGWDFPLSMLAIWCYLVLIRAIPGTEPAKIHKPLLGLSLFLALQISWCGLFFAAAIGVHYVFHCIHRKKLPQISLLAILIFAPFLSLFLNFVIMTVGFGGEWRKIIELFKWRAAKGELSVFLWGAWFAKLWEFALTNFTLSVLIVAIGYLTVGQLYLLSQLGSEKQKGRISRRFPQFWLFLMPAVFHLLILRGSLWAHQFWEFPLIPFVAIAAALGILLLYDVLSKIPRIKAGAVTCALVVVIIVSCLAGLNHYYSVRWQRLPKIEMLKGLNARIQPHEALLSFESFMINQHPVKGAHYRPEIAWYLDREIEVGRVIKDNKIMVAETIKDIQQKAKTGKYPFYLIPQANYTLPIINELAKRYRWERVLGLEPEKTKDGKYLKHLMPTYYIFDLKSTTGSN